jgi:hypothetical protein
LIPPLPSGKKIKLGTLKTCGARFLEVPYTSQKNDNKKYQLN